MLTRRELLERGARAGAAFALVPAGCGWPARPRGPWVNDIHSGLNRTCVARIERPTSLATLRDALARARRERRALSVAAGRHAMGGQQFGADTVLIDVNGLHRVVEFDPESAQLEVEAGIQWPELIDYLLRVQAGHTGRAWGIIQKQTGADRLSLGGALAANAHGRVLARPPMVGDVEAFTLMDAHGELHRCSRSENRELFRLAIGGYGLFGIVTQVRLRLAPRRKVERVVEVIDAQDLPRRFEERIAAGFLFGDFQYSTDIDADDGLRKGVFSCYRPVADDAPIPPAQGALSRDDWLKLLEFAHLDRAHAYRFYSSYYLSTSGQIYWSDTHQLSTYIDDYHTLLAERLGALADGSEMITEIYVRRADIPRFLEDVREDFRRHGVDLIYGTIRLIERDDETFLPWARERFACVIFNLHTQHDPASLEKTAEDFQRLIDRAISYGGSYFLTYHRWARKGPGARLLSPDARLPAAQAPLRSRGALPERLVPALPCDVRLVDVSPNRAGAAASATSTAGAGARARNPGRTHAPSG